MEPKKTKNKYSVVVTRIAYAKHTMIVEAENADKAKEFALENAGDEEFREYDADYEVDFIEIID